LQFAVAGARLCNADAADAPIPSPDNPHYLLAVPTILIDRPSTMERWELDFDYVPYLLSFSQRN
jgi:hypothetical protein